MTSKFTHYFAYLSQSISLSSVHSLAIIHAHFNFISLSFSHSPMSILNTHTVIYCGKVLQFLLRLSSFQVSQLMCVYHTYNVRYKVRTRVRLLFLLLLVTESEIHFLAFTKYISFHSTDEPNNPKELLPRISFTKRLWVP
jgi:hypothetical protein